MAAEVLPERGRIGAALAEDLGRRRRRKEFLAADGDGGNVLEIKRGAAAVRAATADIGTDYDEEPPLPRKKSHATCANHGSFVTRVSLSGGFLG